MSNCEKLDTASPSIDQSALKGYERLSVAGGWHTHLNILRDRLEGKTPEGFWKVHTRLEQEYAERLAAV